MQIAACLFHNCNLGVKQWPRHGPMCKNAELPAPTKAFENETM